MEIKSRQRKNVVWIEVPEELDHPAADKIKRMCDILFLDQKYRHIVFDFTNTKFMDSAGIGMLMGRYRHIQERRGKVVAYRPGKRICRLLEMCGLPKKIRICETMMQVNEYVEVNYE